MANPISVDAAPRSHRKRSPRRVPTALAPALPALILLAMTTAGMVDPPQAGLASQLHLTKLAAVHAAGSDHSNSSVTSIVTPR